MAGLQPYMTCPSMAFLHPYGTPSPLYGLPWPTERPRSRSYSSHAFTLHSVPSLHGILSTAFLYYNLPSTPSHHTASLSPLYGSPTPAVVTSALHQGDTISAKCKPLENAGMPSARKRTIS
jgi:hypothetical protein